MLEFKREALAGYPTRSLYKLCRVIFNKEESNKKGNSAT